MRPIRFTYQRTRWKRKAKNIQSSTSLVSSTSVDGFQNRSNLNFKNQGQVVDGSHLDNGSSVGHSDGSSYLEAETEATWFIGEVLGLSAKDEEVSVLKEITDCKLPFKHSGLQ